MSRMIATLIGPLGFLVRQKRNDNMLQAGERVPDISVPDQEGNAISLADFSGKKVALYFYPKDNTPTCTEQACSLRDGTAQLLKKGIVVVGVSADSTTRHRNFIRKFSLPFPLLADVNHHLIDAFGVWGEKQLFGRKYMGIHRTTFLINEDGTIAHVITKVDAAHHAAQILQTWGL